MHTGDARVEELAVPDGLSRTQVDSVRFAPGARTRWHRHPVGQVLVVTDGAGLVQRRGGPVETIRTFLQAHDVVIAAAPADHAAMEQSVMRIICVRK